MWDRNIHPQIISGTTDLCYSPFRENSGWSLRHNQNYCDLVHWTCNFATLWKFFGDNMPINCDKLARKIPSTFTITAYIQGQNLTNSDSYCRTVTLLQNDIGAQQHCSYLGIEPEYNQPSWVPCCKETHRREVAPISTDWLRLIATCWESVWISKLDGSCLRWNVVQVRPQLSRHRLPPTPVQPCSCRGWMCCRLNLSAGTGHCNYLQSVSDSKKTHQHQFFWVSVTVDKSYNLLKFCFIFICALISKHILNRKLKSDFWAFLPFSKIYKYPHKYTAFMK